jgi:hypothetical protein
VAAEVARTPDATLAELAGRLPLPIGVAQLHRPLRRLGFVRGKKRYAPIASSGRTSAKRERRGPRPGKA